MHNSTDTNKLDKMGETARTVSRTGQKPAHTAMDYALGAQVVNTEILRRTSQAWIEGFRYQVRLSQRMAQVFWGPWGNAFKSMPPVERPGQEPSGPVGIEPATNGAQKVTEPAAKDVQKDIEIAEKVAREAESRTEEAEARAEEAQERSRETERSLKDAQRRTREAERGRSEAERGRSEAERGRSEAERGRSEAESRAGDEEDDTRADAASQPRSPWVRTSGRSNVRGRNTRARNRSSGRRR